MITEDEFYDAVDATLDKLEKEEEKVKVRYFFLRCEVQPYIELSLLRWTLLLYFNNVALKK